MCSGLQVAPELQTNAPFSHIQFSADGKLMLCVAEGRIYQLDAFNGSLQQTYSTGVMQGTLGLGAIFSPDSNYILSGLSLQLAWLPVLYSLAWCFLHSGCKSESCSCYRYCNAFC